MPYEYLEDIAIADVAFRAWSETAEGLFVAAGEATLNVMVEDLASVGEGVHRALCVEADSLEMLLFQLLQELIFLKDAEQLLLRPAEVRISREGDLFILACEGIGERLDPERHTLLADVKAVTLHRFSVKSTSHGWEATVVLDI